MIGARIPRNEDPRLLRGLGCFVDDVNPAGVLHAVCYRSPHAHARLRGIDVSRARAVPGVHLVVTAAELGELNQPGPLLIPHPALTQPRTQRPLAVDEVRYVGETVALVVADDRYVAEDAAGLIVADYEPLPVVIDAERALATGAPLVHGDVPSNRAARFSQRVGDPDQAFQQAAHVLRERLVIERSCGSPIEGRGVVAEYDPRSGVLRVWTSTQAPLPIKNGLAPCPRRIASALSSALCAASNRPRAVRISASLSRPMATRPLSSPSSSVKIASARRMLAAASSSRPSSCSTVATLLADIATSRSGMRAPSASSTRCGPSSSSGVPAPPRAASRNRATSGWCRLEITGEMRPDSCTSASIHAIDVPGAWHDARPVLTSTSGRVDGHSAAYRR